MSMRILAVIVAAAAVAGFAVTADAAPSGRTKQAKAAGKAKAPAQRRSAPREDDIGYDAFPEHYPVGSNAWWRAMDREGRGGCCGNP
jgi:hypothetical protein